MAIDGIVILSQTELAYKPMWVIFVICGLLLVAILFIIYGCIEMRVSALIASIIFFISSFGFTLETCFGHFDIYTGKYQYKCLIEKDTSIQAVYENYTIVDTEGQIWILEDK